MSISLLLIAQLTLVTASADVPMPPPPRGMRALTSNERQLLLERAAASVSRPEAPEESRAIEEASAELHAARALEAAELSPEDDAREQLHSAVEQLGFAHPLRHRLEDALEELEAFGELGPPQLPPVTNLEALDDATLKAAYDIPIELRPMVVRYIQFFRGPGRRYFRKWMTRSTRYIPVMQPILAEHGLPKDLVYQAMIESGFSPQAYSHAHASGPWQFVPKTGEHYGLRQNFWVDERRDPIKSTHAAAKYLGKLRRDFGDWHLAWAGYNAGDTRMRKNIRKRNTRDFWRLSAMKRTLAKETQHYVPKLMAAALVAKNPRAFGFTAKELQTLPPMAFDEVTLTEATDLEVIARAANTSVEALQELNPELKRWCTPPASAEAPYVLRLPPSTKSTFVAQFARIPPSERLTVELHPVRKGDTLAKIAREYRSSQEAIVRVNGLRSGKPLKVRSMLMVPVPLSTGRAMARATPVQRPEAVESAAPPKAKGKAAVASRGARGGKKRVHRMASGETLTSVARRYQVSVEDLRRWNGIRNPRQLRSGQMLTLLTP
jgi:membrane-bound lytic murein transglycosylase D